MAASLSLLGCSTPEQRYRWLSFFFDGVPVPESMQEAEQAQLDAEPENPWDPASAPAPPERQEIQWVYHRPYVQRSCTACHSEQRGFEAIRSDADLCGRCHPGHLQRREGDWVHGAVLLAGCDLCHEPHKAEFAGLLPMPQADLCFQCHDSSFVRNDPYHRRLEELTCSNCHDPHAAGNRKLLADARTYRRNRNALQRLGSTHPDWGEGQCSLCHLEEQSNAVIEHVDQVCLTCHEDVKEQSGTNELHQAVKDDRCTVCHTPHTSPRPKLIRPFAEQLCVSCHDLTAELSPQHPTVSRVDCLLCHAGHESGRPHLLRPGIGVAADQVAGDFVPGPPAYPIAEPEP